MSQYLSDKIRLLSFVLIILVLYIHSGFHANEIDGMYWNNFVQEFISGKLGRLAVPLFFIMSGYLFYLNTGSGISSVFIKLKSRAKSLLIPYAIGCIFFVTFFTVIELIPGTNKYINGEILSLFEQPIDVIFKNVFWMSETNSSPLAFQLWFLRDLIVIIMLSPILYYILKYFKWGAVILFFGLSFINIIKPESLISSIFWFSIGGVFSLTNSSIEFKKTSWSYIILLCYCIVSIFEQVSGHAYFVYLQKVLILFGIIGVWLSYDMLVGQEFSLNKKKWLVLFCGFTFFIYLFHEPTINIVRKLIVVGTGKNSIGFLISYLLSPFVFIILSVLIGSLLRKQVPKTYSILVGGRT